MIGRSCCKRNCGTKEIAIDKAIKIEIDENDIKLNFSRKISCFKNFMGICDAMLITTSE